MIYGLYLSASGVLTSSHRQDVIANNLANADTVGFKRTLAIFQQRHTEAQAMGRPGRTHPTLENIGGGVFVAPTHTDSSQGELESTGSPLDVAIHGRGFFAVNAGNATRLTRNGQFMLDRKGQLILADGSGHRVLDDQGKPIVLEGVPQDRINISPDGTICVDSMPVVRLGFVDVPDEAKLSRLGGTLLAYPDTAKLPAASGTLVNRFVEKSNVDPTTELTQLMRAQRLLEANANMIRYQDQSLSKLVNEVGKIG